MVARMIFCSEPNRSTMASHQRKDVVVARRIRTLDVAEHHGLVIAQLIALLRDRGADARCLHGISTLVSASMPEISRTPAMP